MVVYMRILPVVSRELRTIARRPSAYYVRSGSALAAFVAMAYVALVGAIGLPTGSQGKTLFGLLSIGAFAYCVVAGIRGTSDALSQEKREGTLGLLFLTDLKGYDVVLGKLLSVSVNSIYGILAIAPPLALAFMLGGTNGLQFIMMIVFLLNTLFLSLAVGIFVSTFSHHERPAMSGTLAILFLLLVMPYAIAAAHTFGVLEIWEVMSAGFLLTSPFFAFTSIKDSSLLQIYFDEILLSLAFAHAAGWLCLVVASGSIAQRAHLDTPRGKIGAWFGNIRRQWAYGKAERRRAIRRGLLDRNAFAWLAGRDRLKGRYAWIFLAMLAALWAILQWKASEITVEWAFQLYALWFVHLFFKVWVASEVAARFIEDRRSNALELLLTTPLKEADFVRGERIALWKQFGAPLFIIIAINAIAGFRARGDGPFLIDTSEPIHIFIGGLIHLVLDIYAIHWVAMWRSQHLRGTNRVIVQSIFLIILIPLAGWFVMWQLAWLTGRVSTGMLFWRWTFFCVLYDVAVGLYARHAFFRDFREAATRPFERPAPFQWKIRKRAAAAAKPVGRKLPTTMFTRARKAAVICAILLIGVNVIIAIRRVRLQNELAMRIRQARQSGLPFTSNEVARRRPAVLASESASPILARASHLIAGADHLIHLPDSAAHWNSREKLSPDLKVKISAWVRTNDQLFATFAMLRGRKSDRIPDERMRNSISTDDLARALQAKARLELEDDPVAAAETIALMIHFARVLPDESFQGFVGARGALQRLNELMQRAATQGNVAPEHWRTWQNILTQLNSRRALRDLLLAERASGFEMFSLPAEQLYQRFGRQFGDFPGLFSMGWSIRRYFGQDKAEMIEYLDHMNQYIADTDQPFWEIQKSRERFAWRQVSLASSTFIAPQLLPAFEWLATADTEIVAYQQILFTACEIEIYRAEHGKLPESLSDLGRVQTDPFDGQPLRYVRRGENYSIYSVGGDMTDNGGAKPTGRAAGDIAFHCGAPPEQKRVIKKP